MTTFAVTAIAVLASSSSSAPGGPVDDERLLAVFVFGCLAAAYFMMVPV